MFHSTYHRIISTRARNSALNTSTDCFVGLKFLSLSAHDSYKDFRLFHVFNWLNESISRKIGSLSTVLLLFILALVIYSIVQLHAINKEIKELAQIDIPITDIASEIEILQLQQHILMEKIRYGAIAQKLEEVEGSDNSQVLEEFVDYDKKLQQHISKLNGVVKFGLEQGIIAHKQAEHNDLLKTVGRFESARAKFQVNALNLLSAPELDVTSPDWVILEKQDDFLDFQAIQILRDIETLTDDLAKQDEQHEQRFFYVNTGLGIAAFIIGINVTIFIILSFRRRMRQINTQLDALHKSIAGEKTDIAIDDLGPEGRDELTRLAKDINKVISHYAKASDDRLNLQASLVKQATTDNLTGAYNRHKWQEVLKSALGKVQQGETASLILLDIDYFKSINDNHGHATGDIVLKTLVSEIYMLVRQTDQVFRIGGEEFTILLLSCEQAKALDIAEKIRTMLNEAERVDIPKFTASFGVSEIYASDNEDSLMQRCDEALYTAKDKGRNQVFSADTI
ncbi:MAG: diguanylate cyclase [Alteromonadaceae bacterium]|nr:diguanylate cyclase [Alteromonadaceae bacterium]